MPERPPPAAAASPLAPAADAEPWAEAAARSIPARFERQARLHPERIAVADARTTLTYRALDRLANRVAHALLRLRGAAAEPVALLVGSGVPVVAAMLGVLKTGKFYVALDPSQPPARTAAVLAECPPGVLVVDAERRALAEAVRPAGPAGRAALLDLSALDPGLPEEAPGLPIAPDALAYVVFTSGSTGRPKGVIQDHRYVLHLTRVYTESGAFSAADRLALLSSPSFAGAVRDIHCALLNGAALVHLDVTRKGLASLAGGLRRERITAFFAVASMFRHLCRLLSPDDRFPSVRLVELGSETVRAGDVQLFRRHFPPGCRLVVNLGGSEISPICQLDVDPATRIEGSTVPAGRPVEGVELQLWGEDGAPVAAGAEGEIVVRSRHLSRGYWGRPEETAAAFLPDPEGGDRRLFRTGDLGRLLPDGRLLHLGRRDLQLKIRGHRVEPAEVEGLFTATGLVREAAVVAWPDATGEQSLAAFLVPSRPGAPPSLEELRARAAAALPDSLVPARIVLVDALPLTPTGKLDRRALAAPPAAAARRDDGRAPPRTALERRLEEIWCGLLGRARIGLDEDFFDLGGNSLLALQAMARSAAALRLALPPQLVFERPTLRRLAEAVERARDLEPDERLARGPPVAERPLSPAQRRLWVLAGMGGAGEAFEMVRAFRLEGALDRAALARALQAVGRRHEILRTSFPLVNGQPVQRIAPACPEVLSFADLRHLPEGRQRGALEAALGGGPRLDPAGGPPWRARVVRLGGSRHVLHLALHHLVADDWSIQVLLRELSAAYRAAAAGEDPEGALPPLPAQYADYAAWQERWLSGERLARQLRHWVEHLRGAPPGLALPLDRPRRASQEFRAGRVPLRLGEELTARLRRVSRESETTLFVTLLAAYAVLLRRQGNPEDVVIGTALANRHPVETEALIGFFVNTLALRVRWRPEATFRELLASAHRAALDGHAHPDVPFDRVVEALRPERSALRAPVFQAMLVLQDGARQELLLPGLAVAPLDLARPSAGATFDLTLALREDGGALRGALEFDAALFELPTAERLAAQLEALLAGIARDPDAPVARLPPAAPEEEARPAP